MPILRQTSEAGIAKGHLFDHLVTQQSAQARADLSKFFCCLWRDRRPLQKVTNNPQQSGGHRELGPNGLNIAFEVYNFTFKLAVPP